MKKVIAFLLITAYCLADEQCHGFNYADIEMVLEQQLLESIGQAIDDQNNTKKSCIIIADQLLHQLDESHNCLIVQAQISDDNPSELAS